MTKTPKLFDPKIQKQFRLIFSTCDDIRIVCHARDPLPIVVLGGRDAHGNKHAAAAEIDPGWIVNANYASQFIAAVIEGIRPFAKRSRLGKGSKFKQRRELLERTFLHAALIPYLEK